MILPGPSGLLAATGGETGKELVVLGAGLLARAGRRIGLPTIPLFMAAGILTGPHTPGPVFVRDPAQLGLLATLGLILLLFHLGLEFSLDDLLAGGQVQGQVDRAGDEQLPPAGQQVVEGELQAPGGTGAGSARGW